ncbi:unnamed protein product [Nezara viridula]|uniref:Uncharacterized protein n=1 Tax=Nezara viridula TaxID=85310 RepID=A0A9P0H9Q4_NEZVI|nr:unnamed protein product [Nezara viridula]
MFKHQNFFIYSLNNDVLYVAGCKEAIIKDITAMFMF